MTWRPSENLKPSAERFKQRKNIKMITELIVKALLKGKTNFSFGDQQFEFAFTEETRKPSFS